MRSIMPRTAGVSFSVRRRRSLFNPRPVSVWRCTSSRRIGLPICSMVMVLPLGAVVTDLDGSHCLVTLDRRPLPVEVAGSDDARVYVRGGDGERVVANPASAFGVTSCH